MKFRSGIISALLLCVLAGAAHAADVRFQGRTYRVTLAALGTGNINVIGDLIFVRQGDSKFLVTPEDANQHGDFDIAAQRYYMLDRLTGNVNAYTSITGSVIDLTTLNVVNLTLQNPDSLQSPLEVFNKPLAIPGTTIPTDICIIENTNFIGFRTDGSTLTDEIVYTNTREAASTIQSQFLVNLKNADAVNSNQNVFLEYDVQTDNFLLVQLSLDPNNNVSTLCRLTAYKRDGTFDSEIILDPVANPLFANFSGAAGGLTEDPDTGVIYMLDRSKRQLVVFTPVLPAIASITPNSGTLLGGTKVTITGQSLPADAQVFFGGVAATNISVNALADTVTAFTPAHSIGTVDVTLSGTGLTTILTLPGAFTFVNTPPSAKLSASPTAGPSPLVVSFVVAASDPDGVIASRIISFGDSTSFTFPADPSTTTTSHTYAADGVYTATLTVKDNLGASASDSVTIIVGSTELILRALSFNVTDTGGECEYPTSKDKMAMKGEIVLPEDADIANGKLTVAFVNASVDAANALTPCPEVLLIPDAFQPAVKGGEYCLPIDARKRVNNAVGKFSVAKLKKRGILPNTFMFNFTGTGFRLRTALEEAGVLKPVGLERATVRIIIRIETEGGTILEYTRLAVIDIKSGRKATAKLTRH